MIAGLTHVMDHPTGLGALGHQPPAGKLLVEPLSEREMDVLRLLAEGYPYQQLTERLWISKNTVKSHLQNIFGKLEVTNARQAIDKARKLRLM